MSSTLCELLKTRHVFNELQVVRSDVFHKFSDLLNMFYFACFRLTCFYRILFLFIYLFFFLFFHLCLIGFNWLVHCAPLAVPAISSLSLSFFLSSPGVALYVYLFLRARAIRSVRNPGSSSRICSWKYDARQFES